jgi:hypothetical protein
LQTIGCDNVINSRAVIDRCGVCDGDGSSCSQAQARNKININTTASIKKDVLPKAGTLLGSAVTWFKNLGFNVDRRGHIATPDGSPDVDDTFYWAVKKTGCSVACGGGL